MSDEQRQDYQRERQRAQLRADGSWPSLLLWGAVGLLGSGLLYSILMSVK